MAKERRVRYYQGHPKKGYHYVLGGDPSGGTGNDDAAIIGLCMDTLEQVYAFNDNTTNPVEYAYMIAKVGRGFNNAYIVCEGNNHGLSVHPILIREYPRTQIFKRNLAKPNPGNPAHNYGWLNTESTKRGLTGNITDALDHGLQLFDEETVNALLSFEEDEKGRMGGPGDHLVIALGLACLGLFRKGSAYLASRSIPDRKSHKEKMLELMNQNHMSFDADQVLKELKDRHRSPNRFRRQVA